jgi:hypothetical protein
MVFRADPSSQMAAYMAYMRSPAWRAFRAAWLATYDSKYKVRRCYVCRISQAEFGKSLDLHHRTYERVGGNERFTDLVLVCRPCHRRITREWRARGKTGLTLTLWELTSLHRARAGSPKSGGTHRRSSGAPSPAGSPARRSSGRSAGRKAG